MERVKEAAVLVEENGWMDEEGVMKKRGSSS